VIELRNVSFDYDGKAILEHVSLRVDKGDFAVLVGDTGAGKTTLVQLLIGELLPKTGEIYVGSTRVDLLNKKHLARYRRSIGIISEEVELLDEKNVAENVALPLEIARKYSIETISKNVNTQLETVSLREKAGSAPKELSLGEYQRASIARALVAEPLILIADCPTARLDQRSAIETLSILADQNIRGMTVLLTASELPDRQLFPAKTLFFQLESNTVHRLLPETQE
jgi:cell division transport system ATP-binding protein